MIIDDYWWLFRRNTWAALASSLSNLCVCVCVCVTNWQRCASICLTERVNNARGGRAARGESRVVWIFVDCGAESIASVDVIAICCCCCCCCSSCCCCCCCCCYCWGCYQLILELLRVLIILMRLWERKKEKKNGQMNGKIENLKMKKFWMKIWKWRMKKLKMKKFEKFKFRIWNCCLDLMRSSWILILNGARLKGGKKKD